MADTYLQSAELSAEETAIVASYENNIDLTDSTTVLTYGSECQKKIAEFSDSALEGVKNKDLGSVGDLITGLVTDLQGFSIDDDEKKGLFGLFKKGGNKIANLKARFDTADNNVDKVVTALESHQDTLTKDIVMLDEMYEANLDYFKQLSMYVIAGKNKLAEERSTTLVELQNKANASGLAEDAQRAADFASMCDRLEKKIADLEITRTICVQMAPQIRMIQNSDNLMVEKIQTTINNTIPLWKNQMVLALGLAHSEQAVAAQKAVSDVTNELLRRNAETLHQGAVEIAKESERGIVELDTLKNTNEQLMATLEEVLVIQTEGHRKRQEAETALAEIENQLKEKLLTMTKTAQ